MHGRTHSWKAPIEMPEAGSPGMGGVAHTVEGLEILAGKLRLGGESGAQVGRFPNEEDFVDRVAGIDLELVVGVVAGDEEFHIVLGVDRVVVLRQLGANLGFLDGVSRIEIGVIPEKADPRVQIRTVTRNEIHEPLGNRRVGPNRFFEFPINGRCHSGFASNDGFGDLRIAGQTALLGGFSHGVGGGRNNEGIPQEEQGAETGEVKMNQ